MKGLQKIMNKKILIISSCSVAAVGAVVIPIAVVSAKNITTHNWIKTMNKI